MGKLGLGIGASLFLVVTGVAPVEAGNLLVNSDFELDPSEPQNGWTFEGAGTLTHSLSQGSPDAPSARISAFSPDSGVLGQCVGAVEGTFYDFSSRSYTYASSADSTNSISVSFFSSGDCSTGFLETVETNLVSHPDWLRRERIGYLSPDTTQSALYELAVDSCSSCESIAMVAFDTVFLPEPGSLASCAAALIALAALQSRKRGRRKRGLED